MKKNPLENPLKKIGINPFVANLSIPVNVVPTQNFREITEDGVKMKIYDNMSLEATKFTKMYCSAERRVIIMNCSLRSKELMLWMMYDIKPGEDYFWINRERYMKESSITSINTVKDAILELIRYGIIASSGIPEVYWINPDIFFKGDRIGKYPKSVVLN